MISRNNKNKMSAKVAKKQKTKNKKKVKEKQEWLLVILLFLIALILGLYLIGAEMQEKGEWKGNAEPKEGIFKDWVFKRRPKLIDLSSWKKEEPKKVIVPEKVIRKDATLPEFAFIIGGDVMLDRGVDMYFRGEKLPQILERWDRSLFLDKDLVLVNCEGPISSGPIAVNNDPSDLNFNFTPQAPRFFKQWGVSVASLANNHTLNQGRGNLENTRVLLEKEGVATVGDPATDEATRIWHGERNGIKVAVIATNALKAKTEIESLIGAEKKKGFRVIVFPHWGSEYQRRHSATQERLAHAWVEAGADLIVGSHPHVVEDWEEYSGVPIFYSVGNLIFDQLFSKETQQGLLLKGGFKSNGSLSWELVPIVSEHLKPRLMNAGEKEQFFRQWGLVRNS